jgi:hypothetical protein
MGTNSDNNTYYNRYTSSVIDHQDHAVKFESLPNVRVTNESNPVRVDSRGNVMENSNNIKPTVTYDNNGNTPVHNGAIIRNTDRNADVYTTPTNSNTHYIDNNNNNNNNNNNGGVIRNNNTNQQQNNNNNNNNNQPVRNYNEVKPVYQEPVRNNYQQPTNNYQTPTNNGGSAPRNSGGGGGGGGRPR